MQQAMKVVSRRNRKETTSIDQTTGLRVLAMFDAMLSSLCSLPDDNGRTQAKQHSNYSAK